jgi:hypothetical protein
MKMALERLEPCAMKVARTVLRRVVTGDSHGLSDIIWMPNISYTLTNKGVDRAI